MLVSMWLDDADDDQGAEIIGRLTEIGPVRPGEPVPDELQHPTGPGGLARDPRLLH
jgi:hypothetical protein